MKPQTVEALAERLKQGHYEDPPLDLLSRAAKFIADELASPAAAVERERSARRQRCSIGIGISTSRT